MILAESYIGEWKKTVVGENKANSRDSFWLFCQFTVATATSRRFVARFSANKTIKKAQHRVECFAQCTKTNLFWIFYISAGWKCYARHRKARRRTFFVCKKNLGLSIIKQVAVIRHSFIFWQLDCIAIMSHKINSLVLTVVLPAVQ